MTWLIVTNVNTNIAEAFAVFQRVPFAPITFAFCIYIIRFISLRLIQSWVNLAEWGLWDKFGSTFTVCTRVGFRLPKKLIQQNVTATFLRATSFSCYIIFQLPSKLRDILTQWGEIPDNAISDTRTWPKRCPGNGKGQIYQ